VRQGLREGNAEQAEKDAGRIIAAGNTMFRLLDDVLELSRIGRVVNPPVEVSLGILAEEVVKTLQPQISSAGVQMKIASDLPTLRADRTRLLEVLLNLVENAIKYMGGQEDPRIEIGARQEGHETVCYVRDNGIGIDPQYHEKVFGLFDQLDQKVEGSGVGLALVKRIIEVHGGRIWCESGGEGCGSTFFFAIPSKQEAAAHVV